MKPSPSLSEEVDVLYKPLQLHWNGFFKVFLWQSVISAIYKVTPPRWQTMPKIWFIEHLEVNKCEMRPQGMHWTSQGKLQKTLFNTLHVEPAGRSRDMCHTHLYVKYRKTRKVAATEDNGALHTLLGSAIWKNRSLNFRQLTLGPWRAHCNFNNHTPKLQLFFSHELHLSLLA